MVKQDQILKKPVMTEKSLALVSQGKYTFAVERQAKKREIKSAIEKAFGVNVVSLRIINLKGKKRRMGRRRKEIQTPGKTKAVVKLAMGEKIDLFPVGGQEEARAK